MQANPFFPQCTPQRPTSRLGSVQNDIFFSVMKVIHRQLTPLAPVPSDKVARVSCCCRLSELMPMVRQMHDEARARYQAEVSQDQQQAA